MQQSCFAAGEVIHSDNVSPVVVDSPRVLKLHYLWSDGVARGRVPSVSLLQSERFAPWRSQIVLIERLDDGRMIYRRYGGAIAEANGCDRTGQILDGTGTAAMLRGAYERALDTGKALFIMHRCTRGRPGIFWEKLLLPFTDETGGDWRFLLVYGNPVAEEHLTRFARRRNWTTPVRYDC